MDTTGKEVIPALYESAYPFHENLACVYSNKRSGYINTKGDTVLPFIFLTGHYVNNGIIPVMDTLRRWGCIDAGGKELIPFRYGYLYPFRNGLAIANSAETGLYGFINEKGEEVIPLNYEQVNSFSEGMAAVSLKNSLWGHINKKGEMVVPAEYEEVRDFHEGLAAVRLGTSWGVVDTTGKLVIPLKADWAYGDFKNGIATANEHTGYYQYNSYIIDKSGNVILEMD